MSIRLALPVAAALLLGASAAFAGDPSGIDWSKQPGSDTTVSYKCSVLEKQWNDIAPGRAHEPGYGFAQARYLDGVAQCHASQPKNGAKNLEAALQHLGIAPSM